MKQEVTNFYQFYSTFNRLPYHDNKECLKHLLDISQCGPS